MTDSTAERYSHLTFDEVLDRRLGVMDLTAIILCRDHNMPLKVFDMNKAGALMRVMQGEDEGTLVERGEHG
jgi:uridylate kinase